MALKGDYSDPGTYQRLNEVKPVISFKCNGTTRISSPCSKNRGKKIICVQPGLSREELEVRGIRDERRCV